MNPPPDCKMTDEYRVSREVYARLTNSSITDRAELVLRLIEEHPEGRLALPICDGLPAVMDGVDLSEATLQSRVRDLTAAPWWDIERCGAKLRRADLRGACLNQAKMQNADFAEADLRQAQFRGAELQKTRLEEAKLQGADLAGANLSSAVLGGADLASAMFEDADLFGSFLAIRQWSRRHF
jgi:uncharacterized protein YjbI with pentapeptide repeats